MSHTLSNVLFLSVFGVVLYFLLSKALDKLLAWNYRRTQVSRNTTSTTTNNSASPSYNKKSSSPPPELAVRPGEKKVSTDKKVLGVESVITPVGKDTGRGRG